MKLAFICLAFFIVLSAKLTSFAQNDSNKPIIAPSDASGEETSVNIENIARDSLKNGERLFVIARRSRKEANQISVMRLIYARFALLQSRSFPFQTAIFAVGDPTDGEGRLEFYLGSQLRLATLAKRNKTPNLDCCPTYEPPVKTKQRRKRSKN